MAHCLGLPVRLGNSEVKLLNQLLMIAVWSDKYSRVCFSLCSRVKKGKYPPCRLIGFFPPSVLHTDNWQLRTTLHTANYTQHAALYTLHTKSTHNTVHTIHQTHIAIHTIHYTLHIALFTRKTKHTSGLHIVMSDTALHYVFNIAQF